VFTTNGSKVPEGDVAIGLFGRLFIEVGPECVKEEKVVTRF
jgi:hypothetical protein